MIQRGRSVFFTIENDKAIGWVYESEVRDSQFVGKVRVPKHIQKHIEAIAQYLDNAPKEEVTPNEAVEAVKHYLQTAAEEDLEAIEHNPYDYTFHLY